MIAKIPASCIVRATRMPGAIASWLEAVADPEPLGGAAPPRALVHSVFPRAVNITLQGGRLLALHGPGPLRAPFAIALGRWPLPEVIAAGMSLELEGRALTLGRIVVRWSAAQRVSLEVAVEAEAAEPIPDATRGAGSAGPDSWRRQLLALTDLPVAPALRAPGGAMATRRLADAIAAPDAEGFAAAAGALVGLGEGLTPAGDDCVVGALAVLHRARHSLAAAARAAGAIRRAACTRTTDVGREFLLHAIDGAFAEAVLDVASGHAERTPRGIAALLALGSSSGADTLHGMRLAVRALAR